MAKSLMEEIVNQVTGRRSKKPTRKDRQVQKLLYQMKKNAFEVKRQYNEAQTRAWIKGWKK